MSEIDFIALKAASTAFATDPLPEDWETLSDEDQSEWLDDHKWVHFEDDSNDEFFALIDTHADDVKDAVRASLKVLKEKLIEAAIECDLPSDFNELDLESMLNLN